MNLWIISNLPGNICQQPMSVSCVCYMPQAQRAVRTKLETLERQERKRQEKQLAMKLKNDKVTLKEREREKKRQQRLQVRKNDIPVIDMSNPDLLSFVIPTLRACTAQFTSSKSVLQSIKM